MKNKFGWEVKKLDEISWFQEGPGVRNSQYTDDGVKLLNVANLQDGMIDLSKSKRYISNEEAYGKYKHFLCDEGDLIIASSGIQVDYLDKKMGFVTNEMLPLCMNTSTIRFKINIGNNIKYLMYFFKSNVYKNQISRLITGSAQLNYGPSHLHKIKIPVPPLPTQHQIVSELDALSEIISKKKQQLEELDKLAQATFYDMFGDPVTNEKGWETGSLKNNTTKIGSGATPSGGNQSYKTEGISLIRSMNVHNGQFLYKDLAFIDEIQAKQLNNVQIQENDVLINITGASVARSCIVPKNILPARVNQHVSIIRVKPSLNFVYVNSLFISHYFQDKLLALGKSNGATREAITKSQLENLVIPLPPIEIQNDFSKRIESIESQKSLITQSIVEVQQLFDYTMDKYFV